MINHRVKVIAKKWLSSDVFCLEFILKNINPGPGQFFQVQVNESYDPLLNRPISIASYKNDRVMLIIKVAGKGTEMLSRKKSGDELNLFGPFGKKVKIKHSRSILVAGGIGIAPLYYLAQKLHSHKIDFTLIYGAKYPEDIVLRNEITKLTNTAIFVTEYGSKKRKTALSALGEIDLQGYGVGYACGPKAMLKELKSMNLKMPVYAFCEDFLGCGCGLCLGCAIKYYGAYKRICEDGPVFELEGIEFD
ncbi:MAG: iron-sulfur cluster-binding protein [bacterium]